MFVSIIITTKNEEKNIENCLQSILKQSYPHDCLEIIVVDNSSTDRTVALTEEFRKRNPSIDVKFFTLGPERSAQRNFGVQQSKGQHFLYLDADMILHQNVVSDCVKMIQESPGTIALYVSEIVMGKKFFSQVRRFERSFYDATVIDCARFIRKDAFQKVGGFDEGLTGPEDWDLDKKLRQIGKMSLVTTPIYHNEAEFELRKYLSKKGYYAKKFDTYIEKWGKNDPDVRKQFSVEYRFLGVFVENGKWRKMFAHPLLTLGMFFLRFLVGLKFVLR
jgi:glycosyltransferase involved in cell wall biosynthesis